MPKIKFAQLSTISAIAMMALGTNITAQASCQIPTPSAQALSKLLGWVAAPNKKNICDGYYVDQPIPYRPNPKLNDQSGNYDMKANHVEYDFDGNSIYQGDVKFIEPAQEVTADNAHIYPDKKTGKTKLIKAWGNVHYHSPGFLALGSEAELYPEQSKLVMYNTLYRSGSKDNRVTVTDPETGKKTYRTYATTGHGKASKASQLKPHIYRLHHASYTTCPPNGNVWKLSANEMNLNYLTGWGSAKNAVLSIKGIPVFYSPYYSFPLNQYRKTGFLSPSYTFSKYNGVIAAIPFYWNMAPNYDLLITPYIINRRGVLTNFQFNYLTKTSNGTINASVLPFDRKFKRFQKTAQKDYPKQPVELKTLKNDSDTRYALSIEDATQFNDHWGGLLNYHHVGDDYYESDFGSSDFGLSKTDVEEQLLQQGSLGYATNYWNLTGLLQQYQTLHPVGQLSYSNQYKRLPEFDFQGNTAPLGDLVGGMQAQYVRFVIDKEPGQTNRLVNGERVYADPSLSLPIYRLYGSLVPGFKLHLIKDKLHDTVKGLSSDPGRAIPIFDVDGKLTFVRRIHPFHQNINQTLEPEIYYLYVPYINQSSLPNFDTDLQGFSYNLLFANNRFSGPDRVGDANQVTVGLKTRFIDDDTGLEKAEAGIAELYYFRDRRVSACYGKGCATDLATNKEKLSPIAAEASFAFSPNWDIYSSIGWNPTVKKTASLLTVLHYHLDPHHLFNIGYYHVNNKISGLGIPSSHPTIDTNVAPAQDVRQGIISAYWALNNRWTAIGSIDRNWDQKLNNKERSKSKTYDTFTYGFQYQSCCWALRMVAYRSFRGLNPERNMLFDTGVYFQFTLKGLGKLGSKALDNLLMNDITNYQPDSTQGIIA